MNATHMACMGGWCALRDQCPQYHAEFRGQPSERLCRTGQDGKSDVIELHFAQRATNAQLAPSQQVAA